MIFVIIYFILFIISLVSIPYVVYKIILFGDEYSLITNHMYPYLWITAIIFLVCYFWISIRNIYNCWYLSSKKYDLFNTIKSIHTIMISSIYSSLYMTLFGLIGYICGNVTIEMVPEIKDIFMAIVHIPVFEYILKGLPLMFGSMLGDLLSFWCISSNC